MHTIVFGKPPDDSFFLNARTIHNRAKDEGIHRFASAYSYEILEKRVRAVNDFTADQVRSLVAYLRKTKTVSGTLMAFDPDEDSFLVEKFMLEAFRPLGQGKAWEKESLRMLERLFFDTVHSATSNATKPIDTQKILDGLSGILVQFNQISNARNDAVVKLRQEVQDSGIPVDHAAAFEIGRRVLVGDDEDCRQLVVAIQHQSTSNAWTVFVSTDYTHIISAGQDIYRHYKLTCSPPLYAIAHLKSLSKKMGPLPDPGKGKYIG